MPVRKRNGQLAGFTLADFLPYKLAVATDFISRIYEQNYQEFHNLTIPEWRALAVIATYGTLSPTAVGHHTAMDKVKVSRATQSLADKGLLRQDPDPTDGRGRLLRLTRKGTATYAKMVPLARQLESTLLKNLTSSDVAGLDRALTKIISFAETNGRTPPRR